MHIANRGWGRWLTALLAAICVIAVSAPVVASAAPGDSAQSSAKKKKKKKKKQQQGGPLVLAGIDAQDGGPGGHGPVANYATMLSNVNSKVRKAGTGILVIGGGKAPTDDVTESWNAWAAAAGIPVTYVNGAANITAATFAPFRMIGVSDSEDATSSGGLTQDENNALAARQAEIGKFIDGGGGLVGFTQDGLTNPFAYISALGTFTVRGALSYSDITPTAAGPPVGVTDALDVCCWHETFTAFPAFLRVLATNADAGDAGFGEAAALGGEAVVFNPKKKCKKGFKLKKNKCVKVKAKKKKNNTKGKVSPGFTG